MNVFHKNTDSIIFFLYCFYIIIFFNISSVNAVDRNEIVNKGIRTENANDERIVQLVPVFLIELTVKNFSTSILCKYLVYKNCIFVSN